MYVIVMLNIVGWGVLKWIRFCYKKWIGLKKKQKKTIPPEPYLRRTKSSQSGIHIFIPVDLVLLDNKSHVTKEDEDDDYVSGDIAKNRLVYILNIYMLIYRTQPSHVINEQYQ